MSRKRRPKYYYSISDNYSILYMFLILVLIVLQWFRVDRPSSGETSGVLSESNLVSNGGLFIITLFFLAACICSTFPKCYRECRHHH